uniref:Uncharacterized protein n=1 Tax=Megaviridae environmental sample TaxID=1737588 RepID=A0A5J6VH58_9VIRU|nr:MAG: hypothetical protein [Megaviridae environmental sample]
MDSIKKIQLVNYHIKYIVENNIYPPRFDLLVDNFDNKTKYIKKIQKLKSTGHPFIQYAGGKIELKNKKASKSMESMLEYWGAMKVCYPLECPKWDNNLEKLLDGDNTPLLNSMINMDGAIEFSRVILDDIPPFFSNKSQVLKSFTNKLHHGERIKYRETPFGTKVTKSSGTQLIKNMEGSSRERLAWLKGLSRPPFLENPTYTYVGGRANKYQLMRAQNSKRLVIDLRHQIGDFDAFKEFIQEIAYGDHLVAHVKQLNEATGEFYTTPVYLQGRAKTPNKKKINVLINPNTTGGSLVIKMMLDKIPKTKINNITGHQTCYKMKGYIQV